MDSRYSRQRFFPSFMSIWSHWCAIVSGFLCLARLHSASLNMLTAPTVLSTISKVGTAFGSDFTTYPHSRCRLRSNLSQLISLHLAMECFWKSSISAIISHLLSVLLTIYCILILIGQDGSVQLCWCLYEKVFVQSNEHLRRYHTNQPSVAQV